MRVLGIEECATSFHLGHKASVAANELSRAGWKTAFSLDDGDVRLSYAFGAMPGAASVRDVVVESGGLMLRFADGTTRTASFRPPSPGVALGSR